MITDRLRWTVLEANTAEILTRDLNATEAEIMVNLSAPSKFAFKLPRGEEFKSAKDINWKKDGQVVVCEIEVDYQRQIFGVGVLEHPKVDPASGSMMLETTGFMGYPKGEPWLENFNPIAVDPFEVVQRVWAYLQSFSNAQMNVEVYPASSGTQMLPGFGMNGGTFSFDFFAMFIRSVDFVDSGNQITGLARDIPFDMFEEAAWNEDRTELTNAIRLAYPFGGFQQDSLTFRFGENVKQGELAEEELAQSASDIVIRSWIPGRVYSSTLSNADMTRFRRTAMEEDVHIDSTERAVAWAKRKLTRRNAPISFSKISVNPNHEHAPFGQWWVGDNIFVEAPDYPWVGDIQQWHRIVSISWKEGEPTMDLGLMVEGAFNYDPIDYDPDADVPPPDPNRLFNGYFEDNLNGWQSQRGQWFRVPTMTYDTIVNPDAGSVRVDIDDHGERLLSAKANVTAGENLKLMAAARWQEVESTTGSIQLVAYSYLDNVPVSSWVVDEHLNPNGTHGFELLQDDWTVPVGVNQVALMFNITSTVDGGISWWTFARVIPA